MGAISLFLSLATYFQAKKNRMALKEAVAKVQKLLDQERAKNDVLSREFKDTGSLNVVAKLTNCYHHCVQTLGGCCHFDNLCGIYLLACQD